MNTWVAPEIRNSIVDFVTHYSELTDLPNSRITRMIGIGRDRLSNWKKRYGQGNSHNATIPRHFWLDEWERQAIIAFYCDHPQEGYRRLTYMMIDSDVVAVSPSSVYRVLKKAGLIDTRNVKPSKKGTGFKQPSRPHKHWHIDVSYLNLSGTFYYFCGLIDGFSRFIVHWEIREAMTEADVEIIIQRAVEKFPDARPRIISDNGSQFIANDFKSFIRLMAMTHVRTSPYYPQSNGKIERFHQSLKRECIRPRTPVSVDDARHVVDGYVTYYNCERLHSAIGYIAPIDKLEGRADSIVADRELKLQQAQARRKARTDSP